MKNELPHKVIADCLYWFLAFLIVLFPISSRAAQFYHGGPPLDIKAQNSLDLFSEKMAAAYGFKFITSGLGAIADSVDAPWGRGFTCSEKFTLEEFRPIFSAFVHSFLNKIHQDPVFAEYYRSRTNDRRQVSATSIGIKVAFWDENVNRPLFPYLAQVRFANGEIYYHYADPKTQALTEPIVEALKD